MNDRPTVAELIAAVRQHLEAEILCTLTDARLRFQTLVAANVLAIVERELSVEEDQLHQEWQLLADFLDLHEAAPQRLAALRQAVHQANCTLSQQIRQGNFDEPSRLLALCRQLRPMIERKLEIANPRYLASSGRRPRDG